MLIVAGRIAAFDRYTCNVTRVDSEEPAVTNLAGGRVVADIGSLEASPFVCFAVECQIPTHL